MSAWPPSCLKSRNPASYILTFFILHRTAHVSYPPPPPWLNNQYITIDPPLPLLPLLLLRLHLYKPTYASPHNNTLHISTLPGLPSTSHLFPHRLDTVIDYLFTVEQLYIFFADMGGGVDRTSATSFIYLLFFSLFSFHFLFIFHKGFVFKSPDFFSIFFYLFFFLIVFTRVYFIQVCYTVFESLFVMYSR